MANRLVQQSPRINAIKKTKTEQKHIDMDLENRIATIEERNRRVSLDKKWETSLTRKAAIALITYLFGGLFFLTVIPSPNWYLAALVPVVGYGLSTLSLSGIRKFWETRLTEKNHD